MSTTEDGPAPVAVPADDDTNPKDRLGVKKAPLSLVPMRGVILEAYAFAEGARKYGAFNWRRKAVRHRVYLEAILRHAIAALAGEDLDPDSGLPHEAKIRACCGIILDAQAIGNLIDDRFERDTAAALLHETTEGDYAAAAATLTRTPARTLGELRAAAAAERPDLPPAVMPRAAAAPAANAFNELRRMATPDEVSAILGRGKSVDVVPGEENSDVQSSS